MKKKILAFLLLSLCSQLIFGQRYTISGTITDASNGELLPYSTIIDSVSKKGTLANYYGFYSIKLDKGPVKIMCSYAGFNPSIISFNLTKDTTINLTINSTTEIEEIVVTSSTNKLRSTQMGLVEIPIQETKQLPVLLGEADLMKTIQLMPGIKGGTEGTSGIYVRGGGPDQNLILLDGVPVYNASHAFGVFSVFNSDAIQSFNLMKGGFPARYGGRLSSVIDIKMKEGNNKEFHGEGSIGIISSKLTLEGPIKKEQSSFLISARRTYFDLFTVPITMAASDGKNVGGYYFYDVNAKVNHKFSEKSRLFLSFYTGLDKVYMREKSSYEGNTRKNEAGTGWGNITTALRWNYILSDNLFANFTGTFSQYKFFIEEESNNSNNNDFFSYQYNSGIVDYAAKIDFDYIPHAAHNIKFGTNSIIHTFNPGVNVQKENGGNNNIDTTFGNKNIYATEISSYIEDDIEFSPKFKANIGLHYSFFSVRSRTYNSFQPRLSGRYLLNNNIALKASYIQMMQYIHLLTNSTIGLPTDLWVPSTPNIKPQEAWQTALGTEISLNKGYSLSVEGYYKEMKNLIEYKEGASFFSEKDDWEGKVVQGKGWSYGAEFLLSKSTGKITGWIGYTLSWTNRQFESISFNKVFPYKYDRRHDIAIALTYKHSETFDMGATWVYGTGTATTLATEEFNGYDTFFDNFNIPKLSGAYVQYYENKNQYFEHRNNYRMPAYHRLDIGFNFHKQKKWYKRTWSIGAYNAYNRQNPFMLVLEKDYESGQNKLYQYSIFQILPYFRWSIKF